MTEPKNTYQRVVVAAQGADSSNDNPVPVHIGNGQASAFGEIKVAQVTPVVQAYAHRAADTRVWTQYLSASGGTITPRDDRTIELAIDTTQYAYSTLQSHDYVNYQPGQGAGGRLTAMFSTGVASSTQLAGMFHAEDGTAFGYNGTDFGIVLRYGRKLEIRSLQLTAASTGAETATVTLNGTAHNISLAAETVQVSARKIAEFASGFSDSAVAYEAVALDDTIYFIRQTHGPVAGSFTFSSTGTATGTFTQEQAGNNGTETWTYMADWNIDPLDGTGPSGMTLDPTKFNIYEINYGWLGAAAITYYVGGQYDRYMIPVHRTTWANQNTRPHFNDPRFRIGLAVASLGSQSALSLRSGSAMGYIEGIFTNLGPQWVTSREDFSVTTTETPVIAIQSAMVEVIDGYVSRRRVLPDEAIFSNTGTKAVDIRIYRGDPSDLTGYTFTELDAANESNVWVDVASTAVSGSSTAALLRSLSVPAAESRSIDFRDIRASLNRGEVLLITASVTSSTSTLTVNIHGTEDL